MPPTQLSQTTFPPSKVIRTRELRTSWCSEVFDFANLLHLRLQDQLQTEPPSPSPGHIPLEVLVSPLSEDTPEVTGSEAPTTPPEAHAGTKQMRDRAKKRKRKEGLTDEQRKRKKLFFLNRCRPFSIESFHVDSTPHAASGYVGLQDHGEEYRYRLRGEEDRLTTLLNNGYSEIDPPPGVEVPLTDGKGLVYAVIVGRPPGWAERVAGMNDACHRLTAAVGQAIPSAGRRGDFGALTFGFSYGGGQQVPLNVKHGKATSSALTDFQADPHVRAVFRYMEGPFSTWFPKLQERYKRCISDLQGNDPTLTGPVPSCSFAASTLNVGPQTVCRPHRDSNNVAWGICVDYAFGTFDGSQGGHLVLHEPRLIIRLYSGSAVLFPSAVITHENLPIDDSEERMSLTMYTAGSLVRYQEQGFQTRSQWSADSPEEVAAHDRLGAARWAEGWGMFMTTEELYEHWTPQEPPPSLVVGDIAT